MAIVKDIVDRASEVLNDLEMDRYPLPSLLFWINDSLDLLMKLNPALFIRQGVHSCTAGARQSLKDAKAVGLIDVVGVLLCDKSTLDAFSPAWQRGSTKAAEQWMHALTSPIDFFVYPPSPVGQLLSVEYSAAPNELSSLQDVLPVSDDYVSAISDYVVGMSESKDAGHITTGRAALFMQSFAAKIGTTTK